MKTCPVCGKDYSDTSTLCPIDAAVLQRTSDPLVGQTLADKYSIEKLIKRGGMGAVYLGKHVLMDKTVAIKVLHPSLALDDDVVARFSREAKAASRISHPHAVSVTDFGESENGIVFLVMEYLDGKSLKEIIKADGPMPGRKLRSRRWFSDVERQLELAVAVLHGRIDTVGMDAGQIAGQSADERLLFDVVLPRPSAGEVGERAPVSNRDGDVVFIPIRREWKSIRRPIPLRRFGRAGR